MLANHRYQENRAAASRQGISKTPFKVPLNDENGVSAMAGKTGLIGKSAAKAPGTGKLPTRMIQATPMGQLLIALVTKMTIC